MATRKFNDIEYPVPGIDTAIRILRPSVTRYDFAGREFLEFESSDGSEPPTMEEINAEMEREVEIYNYYLYERNREKAYPKIGDQLDMIYHDIDKWRETIKEIKEKYPKPSYMINN